MNTKIIRSETPEERELARKRAELAELETELLERELDLATLEAELHFFEARYLRIVGTCYAELDEIEGQIAEAEASLRPEDTTAQQRASQARAQAEESAEAAGTAEELRDQIRFMPSEKLKKLYREVAKRIHPDLATNPAERTRRTELMAEANQAYEDGDEARLEAILREWKTSPESITGTGPGAELVRVIRKIAQVEERLRTIERQIAQLIASDLYQLKTKVEEAENKGRDLLAEMAALLDEQIAAARERLASVTAKMAKV